MSNSLAEYGIIYFIVITIFLRILSWVISHDSFLSSIFSREPLPSVDPTIIRNYTRLTYAAIDSADFTSREILFSQKISFSLSFFQQRA